MRKKRHSGFYMAQGEIFNSINGPISDNTLQDLKWFLTILNPKKYVPVNTIHKSANDNFKLNIVYK